jgi:hypothetical protein
MHQHRCTNTNGLVRDRGMGIPLSACTSDVFSPLPSAWFILILEQDNLRTAHCSRQLLHCQASHDSQRGHEDSKDKLIDRDAAGEPS